VRVLLVQPPPPPEYIGFRRTALPEPVALEAIGAIALPHHDVTILDMRLEHNFDETMHEFQPDVVGVTCLTTEVYNAQSLLMRAKEIDDDVFTVVGGLHASLMPVDFQRPYVDGIVLGEGEQAFARLLEVLDRSRSNGRSQSEMGTIDGLAWRREDNDWVFNKPQPLIASLDELRMPARHLTEKYADDYFFLFDQPHGCMTTSRGCPYRCTFCSVWKFYRNRCRYMSAKRVVDELETIKPKHVAFLDDNFLAHVPRAWKILELLKERGIEKEFGVQGRTDTIAKQPDLIAAWRDMGLETILIGFEAASQRKLDQISKGATIEQNERAMEVLDSLGVKMWGAFIVDPDFTREDFQELKHYREEHAIIYPQFTILTPLPGTDFYEQHKSSLLTTDYRLFDALHAVLPTRLPREEFYKEFAGLYRPDNPDLLYRWISDGRITMERARQAREILMELGDYRNFLRGEQAVGLSVRSPEAHHAQRAS
jgi:radical SAM superfamily enzyme YgiQ (UPF0313 family)